MTNTFLPYAEDADNTRLNRLDAVYAAMSERARGFVSREAVVEVLAAVDKDAVLQQACTEAMEASRDPARREGWGIASAKHHGYGVSVSVRRMDGGLLPDLQVDIKPHATLPSEEVERIVHLRTKRDRRIYIAGPMTGIEDFNFPAFNAKAIDLRAVGWHVENPAEHGHIEGAVWADYVRWDISRIATCGAIYLLPGWRASTGARLEVEIGRTLGMEFLGDADDIVASGRSDILSAPTAMTEELKGCPHCGASASGHAVEPHSHAMSIGDFRMPDHPGSYVIEGDCACGSGLIGETQEEVTARWNRRAAPSQPEGAEDEQKARDLIANYRKAVVEWSQTQTEEDFGRMVSEQKALFLALKAGAAAPDEGDTARLDFLIKHEAFVVASYTRLDPTHKYQCWNRNDDPDERHLSGEHDYFDTPREAIDAAMSATLPSAPEGAPK